MRRKNIYTDETLLIYHRQFGNNCLQRRKACNLLNYTIVAREERRTTWKGYKVRQVPKPFR